MTGSGMGLGGAKTDHDSLGCERSVCRSAASDGGHEGADHQTSRRRRSLAGRERAICPAGLSDHVARIGHDVGVLGRMIKGVKQDQLLPRLMPGWKDEGDG